MEARTHASRVRLTALALPPAAGTSSDDGDRHLAPASWCGTRSGYSTAEPHWIPARSKAWFTGQDRSFYVVRLVGAALSAIRETL